jgi:hypothetical protein
MGCKACEPYDLLVGATGAGTGLVVGSADKSRRRPRPAAALSGQAGRFAYATAGHSIIKHDFLTGLDNEL